MNKARPSGAFIGTSLISAIAASLCCITPVIAMLAGSSSLAANFSWLEPARPYLIGLSIIVLAFAWFQQLKPVKTSPVDCNCEPTKKASFLQSKGFLGIITLFAILMMTFPLYAKVFYPDPKGPEKAIAAVDNKQQAKFTIQGMTCKSCEDHVNNELSKVPGILTYTTSYAAKNSLVTFDPSKVDLKVISEAIGKTGYKVRNYELIDGTSAGSCEKDSSCSEDGKACCEKN
ncbi:mercuric transport protein MerTP [Paraflavitalea sp. CAU 1676]|uniref:mercuric transport protein MerTP n=1 Tax=Paraflavitalea sp. CAU 1676 TaxID=3032598 RepID=UPI0023DA0285|nr:mercuric transport protein MerTP [Paraflavitalea sp. CAU 1676]MDF2188650.1 mercuric transport protein MerTP [Paraflavitalea sp. CAU 1676]